jgi:membrane protease YdiL (CAAX protease family)
MTPDRTLLPTLARQPEIPDSFSLPATGLQLPAASRRFFLAAEFLALFIGLPVALFFGLATRLPPLPILWAAALYCLIVLVRDPTFNRRQLWNAAPLRAQLPQILGLFLLASAIVTLLIRLYAPSLLLILVRTQPRLWATILIGYPILSVYPQALVYRAFFFHRYRPLLENGFSVVALDARTRSAIMILVSAATFALMHIVFRNWIAVALTFPGGILFALRYCNTRSLAASSLEHALYGCFLFTIGLGQFFYAQVV